MRTSEPIDGTATSTFIVTKEHRRFEEFCEACRRDRYIGLCHGPPGVGKTLSARRYARWDLIGVRDPLFHPRPTVPPAELAGCRAAFFTPGVVNTPKLVEKALKESLAALHLAVELALDGRGDPGDANHPQRYPGYCELILVDEADRLGTPSLEQLRAHYDELGVGLVLIGMPGLEKRLARYPQLYSRVGFAHAFRPLGEEELRFVLERHWAQLGGALRADDFTDQEAVAAIVRITGGNFRLLDRLLAQVGRIKRLNGLDAITREVVEAARECLVIGTA
jgi:DNA transposition AAA+ family ATPase